MVKHVLANGRQIENVDGYIIPYSGRCEVVYRIIKRFYDEKCQNTSQGLNRERGSDNGI